MHTPYIQPLCDNVMSVAICKLGSMQLVFVKPGTKIDDDCHQDELLPVIWSIADEVYIFHQDSAMARRAH